MIDKVRRRMPWSSQKKEPSDSSSSQGGSRPRLPSSASDTSSTAGNRPRLPSSGENSYGSTMSIGSRSKRVNADEERLTKSRRAVDGYLRKISNVTGKTYTMSRDTGMCYFPHHRFIVVIEVPADHPGLLYIYTCVCKVSEGDNLTRIMQVAMELNYMQHRTRGATLGLENSEVNLCLSASLVGLTPAGLKQLMDDFLVTTAEVNSQLERAKQHDHVDRSSQRSTRSISPAATCKSAAASLDINSKKIASISQRRSSR